MKQAYGLLLMCSLLLMACSTVVFAEEYRETVADVESRRMPMHDREAMHDSGMREDMRDGGPDGGMMEMLFPREIVATADGGVVVLAGNKLLKFDKDLNLTKTVEIGADFEGMKKTMMQMKEFGERMEKEHMGGPPPKGLRR